MTTKVKTTMEDLKDEITELKLLDIRKDISSLKDVICTELLEIKEHVKKTNGSVAKVTAENFALQQEFREHCILSNEITAKAEENIKKLSVVEEETKVFRWITKHPKIVGSVIVIPFLYFGGEAVVNIVKTLISLFL